jgi:FlaA1/EpsC-like NDP-sugar epimerase
VIDVQEISTHGGSLRVFAQRKDHVHHQVSNSVNALLAVEEKAGLKSVSYYSEFQERADKIKNDLTAFLIQAKKENKKVLAYGAAAKGNTLLNYAGIRPDLLPFVVDRNPAKQNKYLPGCRVPIVDEAIIKQQQPNYVLIMPWNLRQELIAQLAYIRDWGGKFVTAVPNIEVN